LTEPLENTACEMNEESIYLIVSSPAFSMLLSLLATELSLLHEVFYISLTLQNEKKEADESREACLIEEDIHVWRTIGLAI
jgi:hypothetical protein